MVSEEEKLSSSDMRRSILGECRTPLVRSCDLSLAESAVLRQVDECAEYDPQLGPFVIGLTGAMATGKSTVVGRLVEKGAYPIDCDKVRLPVV